MTVSVLRGNALLPLADGSVDLVVTSPPFFGLRSYLDGGVHYTGQLGSEATPAEFVDALLAATAEMVRVVKRSGSIWVNLGDKYAGSRAYSAGSDNGYTTRTCPQCGTVFTSGRIKCHHCGVATTFKNAPRETLRTGIPTKSLIGIPWRYALRCIDELGLILRAEVIWSKPNGLPESVTDRVRRSHETWFHFVKQPRYFSAVDEIREGYSPQTDAWRRLKARRTGEVPDYTAHVDQVLGGGHTGLNDRTEANPLGKLPGSVWTVPTQPLSVPAALGVDHFAAFPMEWPRRIIAGWSPGGVCVGCGEGRRPVAERASMERHNGGKYTYERYGPDNKHGYGATTLGYVPDYRIIGYACGCPDTTAPTTPAVVLDPFGGTGTTALVAHVMGRHGISVDLSSDYCRLAAWRTSDPGQLAAAALVDKPVPQVVGQETLFEGWPA